MSTLHLRTALLLASALIASVPARAAECDAAEKLRLSDEAQKLAQRNAWTGVERAYEGMVRTRCILSFDEHQLGAQSARRLGKTWEMYERLTSAKQFDPQQSILDELASLDANYGRVDIKGDARRRPELVREAMPFAPDQRKSIEYAQTVMAGTGSFKGMLPLGEYLVGDKRVEIEAGPDFKTVVVGKVKGSGEASVARASSEGFVNYAHLLATVGPNFLVTPEPGSPVLGENDIHQFAPHDIFASGFGVAAGGEVGLTYSQPELAVAATVGYEGGFGTDTLHLLTGNLSAVLRPGQLRIAAGPSYGILAGKGTGVATWFDVDHDKETDPNENIRYQGSSWGGGLQGSVGYGLLDFDKLRGVVELTGGWHTDGSRSFSGFGLRVGVIPTVPRFEG